MHVSSIFLVYISNIFPLYLHERVVEIPYCQLCIFPWYPKKDNRDWGSTSQSRSCLHWYEAGTVCTHRITIMIRPVLIIMIYYTRCIFPMWGGMVWPICPCDDSNEVYSFPLILKVQIQLEESNPPTWNLPESGMYPNLWICWGHLAIRRKD